MTSGMFWSAAGASRRDTAPVVTNVSRTGTRTAKTVSRTVQTQPKNIIHNAAGAAPSRASRAAATAAAVGAIKTNSVTPRTAARAPRASNSRAATARSASAAPSIRNNDVAQMTDLCITQYQQCMDNYCNVLDETKGRCTCGINLKNYEKNEAALKQANESLQDVAQKIQYIGLTTDEIESLFTQTEAEIKMQLTTDASKLKNDLDSIKSMIIETRGTQSRPSSNSNSISMNLTGLLDFNLDNPGFDGLALFSNGITTSTNNQQGAALYKTATARCKASVLNNCIANRVDAAIVTNKYDMEIERACIAYERHLTQQNEQIKSMVRNATVVLQNARLAVGQNKNKHDLRACVAEMDKCMRDDTICGPNYEKCLDPTGKFIVNGNVVTGSTPNGELDETRVGEFLRSKIGTIDARSNPKGMCAHVMKNCQKYVINDGKYIDDNQVITDYLTLVMPQIRVQYLTILNEFSTDCINDVKVCLSQNTKSINVTTNGYSDTAINACMSKIRTCRHMMDPDADLTDMMTTKEWVVDVLGIDLTLEDQKNRDHQKCLALPGGHVSQSGGLCIIWNPTDITSIHNYAMEMGGVPHITLSAGTKIDLLKKKLDATVAIYVMPFAYQIALQECTAQGGTLNIAPGAISKSLPLVCTVTKPAAELTQGQCDAMQLSWSVGHTTTTGALSGYQVVDKDENDNPITAKCSYNPKYLFYVAADFSGTCEGDTNPDSLKADANTGHCVCAYPQADGQCSLCPANQEWDKIDKACTSLSQEERDKKRCLAIPNAKVTSSGKACIITANQSSDTQAGFEKTLLNHAKNTEGCAWTAQPSRSDYTQRSFPDQIILLYVFKSAYLAALDECTARGGTLNISPDTYLGNAHIYCTIPADSTTKEQCQLYQTQWPGIPTPFGDWNETTHICRYTPSGMTYIAKDLPGKCQSNSGNPDDMNEDSTTGNCVCKYGTIESGFYCNACPTGQEWNNTQKACQVAKTY